jgi:hypothetical protein
MVVFPIYKKVFSTSLNRVEINKMLKGFVSQFQRKSVLSNKFYGELFEGGFEIYKNSYLFNTTLVKISGKYNTIENKTEIELRFTLSEHVWVFHILIYLISLFLLFFTITEAEEIWLKLIPTVFIILNYLIIMIPFNVISYECEQVLKSKLELKNPCGRSLA